MADEGVSGGRLPADDRGRASGQSTNSNEDESTSASNPFEVLGVDDDVDDRGVRRAYAKKIREARAVGDNERIETVQSAFEAIRDEEQREKIKAVVSGEDRIRPLIEQAQDLIEEEDLRGASSKILQILEIVPSFEPALLQLIQLETAMGRYDHAQRHAARLVSEHPENVGHLMLAAEIVATRASLTTGDEAKRSRLFNKALKACRRARERGDHSATNVIFESQMRWNLGDLDGASGTLRTKLREAHELKSNELLLFLALLRIHVLEHDKEALRQTAARMIELMPKTTEQRESIGCTVYDFACELVDVHPDAAVEVARITAKFCPENPYAEDLIKFARERHAKLRRQELFAKRAAAREAERRRRLDEGQYAGRSRHARLSSHQLPKTRSSGLSWVGFLLVAAFVLRACSGSLSSTRERGRSESRMRDRAERYQPSRSADWRGGRVPSPGAPRKVVPDPWSPRAGVPRPGTTRDNNSASGMPGASRSSLDRRRPGGSTPGIPSTGAYRSGRWRPGGSTPGIPNTGGSRSGGWSPGGSTGASPGAGFPR